MAPRWRSEDSTERHLGRPIDPATWDNRVAGRATLLRLLPDGTSGLAVIQHDDECIHGLASGTCSLCARRGGPRSSHRRQRSGGSPTSLTTPAAVERYRSRYPGAREATFEAYVDVFFRLGAARSFPGGWTAFSRCANGEPALVATEPELVRRAEEPMRVGGYDADDSGRPQGHGRQWLKMHQPVGLARGLRGAVPRLRDASGAMMTTASSGRRERLRPGVSLDPQ
jgi:hypothetical protein